MLSPLQFFDQSGDSDLDGLPALFEIVFVAVIGIGHGLALATLDQIEQKRDRRIGVAWRARLDPCHIRFIHGEDMRETGKISFRQLAPQSARNIDPVPPRRRNRARIWGFANVVGSRANSAAARNAPSAMGERQILPRHTNSTDALVEEECDTNCVNRVFYENTSNMTLGTE